MSDVWERIRTRWPKGTVPRADFLARLKALGPEAEFPEDLYWAQCCLAGDRLALDALERTVVKQLARRRVADDQRGELATEAMAQLVVGTDRKPPKLEQYAARAPLDGWVHVVVTRLVLDSQRAAGARNDDAPLEDAMLGEATEGLAPELALAREQFRGTFAAAFRAALAALDSKERLMLRQHYLDGVSLEALARMHAAGRSTVARKLQGARHQVLESMRDEVRRRTGLRPSEIESMLKVVRSRLALSMSALREG